MSHIQAQESASQVGSMVPTPTPEGSVRGQMLREFWYYFSENKGAVLGLVVFSIVVVVALFAPILAPHNPAAQNRDALLLPPVFMEGGRIVEQGPPAQIFGDPQDDRTRAFLRRVS